ncbi:lipase maturation factor 2-like isoform X1 [Ostrea edulis]|uniref:lipase maturation factor 2-like isoform X1 n=1 Tax=Ostrea edulis TaxID=37623 RepID=UPI0024AFE0CD|nr:lipase maturation factor 2-like isoform X1 [Ostrea edulis]
MSGIKETRDFFLWCISVIYLIAFSSLYVQIPGLYGDNGILPAKLAINSNEISSWEELLEGQPTLLRLMPKLGLDIETGMDVLCILGILISFCCVVFTTARDMVSFTLLWMMYLSLYQVGQTFLWFQWDILLLETGFLTILVAPLNMQFFSSHHHHDKITMWLVRWLLFRLMFASGVVKLTSGCPTWWGLTALAVHFESQCIPTALAWFWHHLPKWFLKLSCVATYLIEIPIPLLFFSPVKSMRMFAFYTQILLQMLIIVTGNYNFFNLLTTALCFSLVEDDFFKRSKVTKPSTIQNIFNKSVSLVIYSYLAYQTGKQFSLQVSFSPSFEIKSNIAFSKADFFKWLEFIVPWTIVLGAVSLGYHILISIVRCLIEEKGLIWKFWSFIQCSVMATAAIAMFSISLVPHTVVEKHTQQYVSPDLLRYRSYLKDYHLTNSYGLFRRMTGVGGRPEVIIEGSNSPDGGWKEYQFYYKPGNVSKVPPIVAPHQPRLDWQMWFAALGSYQHNTWFVHLIYRLMTGQREVLDLIQHNPFPDKPPRFIRAKLYHYHFTGQTPKDKWYSKKDWWVREEKNEYFPALEKDNESLIDYLRRSKILMTNNNKKTLTGLGFCVNYIRQLIGQPEGFSFVITVTGTAVMANVFGLILL